MVLTSSRCSSGTRSRNLYLSAVRDFEALSARQKKGGHETEDAVHLLLPLFAAAFGKCFRRLSRSLRLSRIFCEHGGLEVQ